MKTNKHRTICAILCAALISASTFACLPLTAAIDTDITVSAANTSQPPKLNLTQLSLGKGESYKLSADQSVSWRTSEPKTLTVDKNGNVKAVGIGTAWITAKNSAGKESSCKITVKNAPGSVSVSQNTLTLGVGEEYSISAILPEGSASASRTFRSSNSSIVKMTKTNWTGSFKAVKTGTATVTVKLYNGREASCKVTVKKAPSKVSISQSALTLGVGEEYSLSASVPEGSASANRTFRISNSSIVKMTKTNWTGSFKALKPGTAWVTVRTYNGKEASCKVTVKKAPTWVSISEKTLTLTVGQTATLSASIASDAGCAKRTFRTSNSSIVKMTKTSWTGSFKALKPGTAWVTVRTYNGKESSCKITVVKDWRTLYKEKLRSLESNTNCSFELYDVDKDGVPELFISTNYPSWNSMCSMYYVYNGQLKDSGLGSVSGLIGVGDSGYIYTSFTRMGAEEKVYKKTGGTIKLIYSFYANYLLSNPDTSISFQVNGKSVSQSEYDKLHDKYWTKVNKKNVGIAHTLWLSYNDINMIIDHYPYVLKRERDPVETNYHSTLVAYDEKGNLKWEYKAKDDDMPEFNRICDLGKNGDHYYITDIGTLVCLNKNTGKKLWEVSGVGYSNKCCFDSSGNIYITGTYGHMLKKIDPNGKVIWRFDPSQYYYDGSEIELVNNTLRLKVMKVKSDGKLDYNHTTILVDAKTGKLL